EQQISNVSDTPAGNNAASDLPQVQSSTPASVPAAPASNQSSLITVTTPTQIVRIDPLGGDIVGVSLPKFPTSLEARNNPFTLMHADSSGVYVAQSGLIGRNGPDAASAGRPRYQSAQTQYSLSEGQLNVDLVMTTAENVQITKRFIFDAQDYLIRVQY